MLIAYLFPSIFEKIYTDHVILILPAYIKGFYELSPSLFVFLMKRINNYTSRRVDAINHAKE